MTFERQIEYAKKTHAVVIATLEIPARDVWTRLNENGLRFAFVNDKWKTLLVHTKRLSWITDSFGFTVIWQRMFHVEDSNNQYLSLE